MFLANSAVMVRLVIKLSWPVGSQAVPTHLGEVQHSGAQTHRDSEQNSELSLAAIQF